MQHSRADKSTITHSLLGSSNCEPQWFLKHGGNLAPVLTSDFKTAQAAPVPKGMSPPRVCYFSGCVSQLSRAPVPTRDVSPQ
eukprot:5999261-Amphidinium_carterae.1